MALVEQRQINLLELRVCLELSDEVLLVEILGPKVLPLTRLLGTGDVELPMDIFARLAAQSTSYIRNCLNAAIRFLAWKANPSAVTHGVRGCGQSDGSARKYGDSSRGELQDIPKGCGRRGAGRTRATRPYQGCFG